MEKSKGRLDGFYKMGWMELVDWLGWVYKCCVIFLYSMIIKDIKSVRNGDDQNVDGRTL